LVVLFIGDSLSLHYRIPGNRDPFGSVEVEKYYAVLKKDGKTEYMFAGTETETCVRALFPHSGYPPCWYAKKHTVKRIDI
jgi:hypothetical protein